MVSGSRSSQVSYSSPFVREQAIALRKRAELKASERAASRAAAIAKSAEAEQAPKNVMEVLVESEIEAQLEHLSPKERATVKAPQIMAYALNRLPGLYVTSEKGWERQWNQGQSRLAKEIKTAVRQGIIAVQRDPLRAMSPLESCAPDAADAALGQLQRLLRQPALTWYNLVPTVRMIVSKAKAGQAARRQLEAMNPAQREALAVLATEQEEDSFDWDSHPLYQRGF